MSEDESRLLGRIARDILKRRQRQGLNHLPLWKVDCSTLIEPKDRHLARSLHEKGLIRFSEDFGTATITQRGWAQAKDDYWRECNERAPR